MGDFNFPRAGNGGGIVRQPVGLPPGAPQPAPGGKFPDPTTGPIRMPAPPAQGMPYTPPQPQAPDTGVDVGPAVPANPNPGGGWVPGPGLGNPAYPPPMSPGMPAGPKTSQPMPPIPAPAPRQPPIQTRPQPGGNMPGGKTMPQLPLPRKRMPFR